MKLIPSERNHLARGEQTALVNFIGDTAGLILAACMVAGWWRLWVGLTAFGVWLAIVITVFILDCIGEHRYQLRYFGVSDYTLKKNKR